MHVLMTWWDFPIMSPGKSCGFFVGVFVWAPAPFSLLLRRFLRWRNANLAGGFACRLVLAVSSVLL